MGAMKIVLLSPLSPEECVTRLEAAIDRSGFDSFWNGTKPVVGKISGNYISLHRRKCISPNSRPYLNGTLEAQDGGTVLRGTVDLHPIIGAPLMPLFVMAVVFYCFIFLIFITGVLLGKQQLGLLIPLVLMPLSVAATVKFGRFLFRSDSEFLISFLSKTLDVQNPQVSAVPR
jgi:hypothetical protein